MHFLKTKSCYYDKFGNGISLIFVPEDTEEKYWGQNSEWLWLKNFLAPYTTVHSSVVGQSITWFSEYIKTIGLRTMSKDSFKTNICNLQAYEPFSGALGKENEKIKSSITFET